MVDPDIEEDGLRSDMANRGVHLTTMGSTLDALVEFGRTNPAAVMVAPGVTGIAAADFVQTILRYATPFVIAVFDPPHESDVDDLMLAGCGAVIERPYDAAAVWTLLDESGHALDVHTKVSFGPIELDARAFTVTVRGDRIQDLPLKEFELLRALMCRAPGIISNDELRTSVWGPGGERIPDNTLAVHVARLRNRLQRVARIRRIRGRGYALTLD